MLFDGGENEASSGTVWIDDVGVMGTETSADVQGEHPEALMEGEPGGEDDEESQEEDWTPRLCGNMPGIVFVILLGAVWMRKREI